MSSDDYKFIADAYFDMRAYYKGILSDKLFIRHYVDNVRRHGCGIPIECLISFLVGLGWNPDYVIECLGVI